MQYRGRAVPIAWRVLKHPSSMVELETYQALLQRVNRLLPEVASVRLLADRGFADTKLMSYLQQLGWHYRLRIKNSCWVYRPGRGWVQLKQVRLALGEAVLWQGVKLTKARRYGLVNLALASDPISHQTWYVVSDQPVSLQTFREYGERFQIEEEFLDEKSNGFGLEQSQINSATALSRLCLVLAVTMLFLTAQGQQVVASGKRRWVDCHWQRGNSYLRIGWDWVRGVLHRGWKLFRCFGLRGHADPEPAVASYNQAQKQFEREFTVRSYCFAT